MNTSNNKNVSVKNVFIIFAWIFACVFMIAGLVLIENVDYTMREEQKASGNFSGYVSHVEPILQNATTIYVSVAVRIDDTDPEIVILGPEFASLTESTLLELTGCTKNPKGFWENCQVK